MEQLQAKAGIQISKPIKEVFEAIVDPKKMSNYFISESSGRMEEGKTLTWKFPEFEDRFSVEVAEVTEGWANFLACLKAYLEYGINLRKGAFDYMKKE